VQKEAPNGELVFTMTFQSLDTPYKMWSDPDRVARYNNYFGPNVNAKVLKVDAEQRIVGIELTTYTGDKYVPIEGQTSEESNNTVEEKVEV
jgi:Protein of unknown function (DUF2854)